MTGASGGAAVLARDGAVGAALAEMVPLLRRVVGLDARTLARVRSADGRLSLLVRLPFDVLAARSVAADGIHRGLDSTVAAAELLAWLDGERDEVPSGRDADWRGSAPPMAGWQRVDVVPDDAIRSVVRSGALALKDAAAREGVPGASPRAEVADALLDAIVLTVAGEEPPAVAEPAAGDEPGAGAEPAAGRLHAEITLRTVSALTRLGFLARGSHAAIDVAGRWTRVAGTYGTVYAERPAQTLGMLR